MSTAGTGVEPIIQDVGGLRPKWRMPRLTEDTLADITLAYNNQPGDEGITNHPNYINYGPLS